MANKRIDCCSLWIPFSYSLLYHSGVSFIKNSKLANHRVSFFFSYCQRVYSHGLAFILNALNSSLIQTPFYNTNVFSPTLFPLLTHARVSIVNVTIFSRMHMRVCVHMLSSNILWLKTQRLFLRDHFWSMNMNLPKAS